MKVPVIVLSGFLGSGKTTLLLRLIEEAHRRGFQPGILMNELGKHYVDGHIVDGHQPGLAVEKLLDGCVCCSKKSELAGSIIGLLRRSPDVIFIELTSVANPEEIADALTEGMLIGKVSLQRIVTILDAEHVLDYNSIFASDKALVRTLRRQIEVADFIVVNKTDLTTPAQMAKIDKVIRKQNEQAPVVRSTLSRFDLKPLFVGIQPLGKMRATFRPLQVMKAVPIPLQKEGRLGHSQSPGHVQEGLRSFSRVQTIALSVRPDGTVPAGRIEQFLHRWKRTLLRAKGYFPVSSRDMVQLMQYAGNRVSWTPIVYSGQPYIVFIGLDLDAAKLSEEWGKMMYG